MADNEEYFPRGGKKPTTTYFKQSENFLGGTEKGERKKRKQKKKSEADDGYLSDEVVQEVDQSFKTCGIWLSYKVVKQGQLLLGRVKQVKETSVLVALPCRMQGIVMACHISEAYNKLLEAYVNDQVDKVRELSEMFRPGQYVAVKVVEVKSNTLMLSMMPQHVHSARTLADLHKGALLQAAVSSVEDHGFVMDIGIPGTRAFLPKDSANPDVLLDTGVLAWTTVKSLSAESGVVTLSSHLDQLQKAFQRKPAALLPATALDFTVDKALDNGIEGHVLDRVTAYIQRNHVDMVKGKKPALGHKIRARLLYVVPPNNIPFLTMRNIFETTYPDLSQEQKFDDGDIIDEAQVIKIVGRTVQLKLGEGSIGVLSLRRVTVHEDLTDEQVLLNSYPIGSTHKVRVLCYNLLDFVYSVTDDPSVVNEKYFKLSQLSVGDVVEAKITTVADNCLYVAVGRVSGHVPQLHMSETGIFVDPKKASHSKLPKKKFKVDQVVTGRVLSMDVEKQRLSLTLKLSLLDPELDILQSYDQAAVGKVYIGVIVNIKDYLLVSFFNNITAFVPKRFVSSEPLENLSDAFHIGQIVKCTIISVNPEEKKMSGSLTTPPFTPSDTWSKSVKRKNIEKEFVPKKQKKTEETPTPEDSNSADSTNCQEFVPKEENNTKEILTPEDLSLIDLTNCQTVEQLEDRVVSIQKFIKTRKEHKKRISKKIAEMEEKGLDAKNKQRHTEMHAEKLIIQQRIQKLNETLKIGQDKLKEMNVKTSKTGKNKKDMEDSKTEDMVKDKKEKKAKKNVDKVEDKLKEMNVKTRKTSKNEKEIEASKIDDMVNDNKEKKAKKNVDKVQDKLKEMNVKTSKTSKNEKQIEASKIEDMVCDKKEKKAKKNVDKIKEVKVLDNLQPAVDVPSAKDFWSLDTDFIADKGKEEESSSTEEEEEEKPKKKRKKLSIAEKAAKAREEEERIREMEKRAIESENAPRSSDQFERALLAQPNCSQLWIAYMAFHLQATEIDKARAVGRKALNTINFREEGEKLNVWLALLNLEHRFGTKESQQKTLEDALQTNDTYEIHSKLLDILVDTSEPQELVSLVEKMLRKYRRRAAAYAACGDACFRAALPEKARQVMQKGIAALEKKEHVSLLVRFAQLERALGDRERSEALFEQVLAVYPQRVDVCSAYIDILLRAGDVDRVRQVMERMTSLQLPARKMKVLYKKWIAAEEQIGDAEHAEAVRQRAVQFIDRAKF